MIYRLYNGVMTIQAGIHYYRANAKMRDFLGSMNRSLTTEDGKLKLCGSSSTQDNVENTFVGVAAFPSTTERPGGRTNPIICSQIAEVIARPDAHELNKIYMAEELREGESSTAKHIECR